MQKSVHCESASGVVLSVVVPVYGVESTLDGCVESILAQDVSGMEVVLVDDGSPDACPAMCDAWAQREPAVSVVHRANGGLSAARNSALDIARGRYVMFVDSDDRLAPGTIAPLIGIMEREDRCDMLEFPVRKEEADGTVTALSFPEQRYDEPLRYWTEGRCYAHSYACNKVFRRSAIGSLRFDVGRKFEDVRFTAQLLQQARTVMTTGRGLYIYTYNADGITATADRHAIRDLLEAHLAVMAALPQRYEGYDEYYMHVVNIQIVDYERSRELPLLPRRRVSVRRVSGRLRWKAAILRLLGMHALCRIVALLRQCFRRAN